MKLAHSRKCVHFPTAKSSDPLLTFKPPVQYSERIMASYNDSLEYHSSGRPGKIEVVTSKPCDTERELSLAYSPGVAQPCIEIAKDPSKVFDYTVKGNLVAVITNGTAVLGLGDIGPLAGKPVMEGKACLFKKFADIDVFDLELAVKDV